jgi:hypothetical protein
LAAEVEAVRIAAKTRNVLPDPGDGAADLIGEHHQIAADVLHPGEVGDDIMRPGGEEHLGRPGKILRAAAAPGAAMDKDKDRRCGPRAAVDVESLDLGPTIGDALGLAQAAPRHCALADAARDQLLAVGRISGLVIGRVEGFLVVIEKYRRAFFRHRTPLLVAVHDRPRTEEREA